MSEERKTCKDLVRAHFKSRMEEVTALWAAYREDSEKQVEDLGNWNEYGLSFDYVAPGTFKGQRRGYFRYQISWGGPSDEFRFYSDEQLGLCRVEYWYMDWFDGAKVIVGGKVLATWQDIWDDWKGCDLQKAKMEEASE